MRIGELLLGQRKVRQADLQRCIEEQAETSIRLVSLLIRAGHLDFDEASRALGGHRGMPCVLTKHLTARDVSLASMIPAELARTWCALPIGRTKGALVVCVRDPGEQVKTLVEKHTRGDVLLVISPALHLEKMIADTYGAAPVEEFDVALDSAVDLPSVAPPSLPPMPDMDVLDPESVRLSLTDLDDARVTKDLPPGQLVAASQPRMTLPPPPPTMAATAEALELAPTRDDATEAVMRFVAGHWIAGAVLALREDAAIGYRGHGDHLGQIETLIVPLLSPSTVQRAVETKRTAIQSHTSGTQDDLARRLGTTAPAASPVIVRGEVVAVIAVGDPIYGRLGDTERAISELGRLAQLLGSAWERVLGAR